MVSSELRIALLALKISSTNATVAEGRYPSIWRTYWSFSRPRMERGPKSSSGTEKRVRRRSKKTPWHTMESLRPSSDLAVPGGPRKRMCSPAMAARSISRTSASLSTSPTWSSWMASPMRSAWLPGTTAGASESSFSFRSGRIAFICASTWAAMVLTWPAISSSCLACSCFHAGSSASARHASPLRLLRRGAARPVPATAAALDRNEGASLTGAAPPREAC
mmetsp:Transcript_38990/g.124084  ORF Transcript_38990/g.124084 Transcript_38990/m.124084 type:complete len:221 (+) Transcript_38990:1054-1716(+)